MTENDSSLITDPEILLSRIREEWEALAAAVSAFDDARMVRREAGQWSVKDILAHVTWGEKLCIATQFLGIPAARALDVDPGLVDRERGDEVNAILFERNRDRSLADIRSDLYETHRRLLSELSKMSEGELKEPTPCFGAALRPRAQWVIWDTCEHYREHRRTIEMRRME